MADARWFEEADRPAAIAALDAHLVRVAQIRPEWGAYLATDATALLNSLQHECAVVMVGDYLIAFQIVETRFMPGAFFFQEEIILRVTRNVGNGFRSVVTEMTRLARINGFVAMQVGTDGDDRLGYIYQKLGFKPTPAQLIRNFDG